MQGIQEFHSKLEDWDNGDHRAMTEGTKYIALTFHQWDGCELKGCPSGFFGGMGNGSIGFMPVFDDIEKLKAAYPDGADILKITATGRSE